MLPLRAALLALIATALGCSGECETVATDRDTVDGTAVYRPASTTTPFTLSKAGVWDMSASSLMIDLDLASDVDRRFTRVTLKGLAPGAEKTFDDTTTGEACLVQQTNADPTCLPLTGTVLVKRLDADCFHHESGISVCAENIDVTLHARATQPGTELHIDVDVVRTEHWTNATCEDD